MVIKQLPNNSISIDSRAEFSTEVLTALEELTGIVSVYSAPTNKTHTVIRSTSMHNYAEQREKIVNVLEFFEEN